VGSVVGAPLGSAVGDVVGSTVVGAAVGSSVGGMQPQPQFGAFHDTICVELHCKPSPWCPSAQYVAQSDSSSKYMRAPDGAHEVSIVGRGVVGPGLGGLVGDGLIDQNRMQSTFNAVGFH